MIKHVVMFKLAEKTPENMERATQSLKSLEGSIETLKAIEIYKSLSPGSTISKRRVYLAKKQIKLGMELKTNF